MKVKTNGHTPSNTLPRFAEDANALPAPPKQGLAARVPPTLALAVVAGILAALFFLAATGSNTGRRVAIAARDIRPGEAVDIGALRFANIDASPSLLATLIAPRDVGTVKGFIATHAIPAGALVARSDLAQPAASAQQRTMSLPIDPEHAVGGALAVGDRVDVVDGSATPEPAFVITDAEVVAVGKPSGSSLGATRKYSVTVAVDAPGALRLAAAIARDKVEVVRSTGAPAAPPGPLNLPPSNLTQPAPTTASDSLDRPPSNLTQPVPSATTVMGSG